MPNTRYLPLNEKGRDFVVGDIHGMYSYLDQALRQVAFNPAADRLFPVGDLMDRGPESGRANEILGKPWVFPVRGNHDEIFLDIVRPDGTLDLNTLQRNIPNGLKWVAFTDMSLLQSIAARLREVPYALQFETMRGSVGIVHAEVPAGLSWPNFMRLLDAGHAGAIESATWGRHRITHGDARGVPGIGRVFSGHTPQPGGPTRLGNVYYIDTGAFIRGIHKDADYALTFANAASDTQSFAGDNQGGEIDLRNKPVERPFGQYVLAV